MKQGFKFLLPVLFTVGSLRGLQPTGRVAFEMLSQAGAGGETLVTSFTLVRLVPSVDTLVVHKIPLRPKSLLANLTLKRSFARVFPHVHCKRI